MPNASETLPTTGRYRLLGHPTDLAGHVATLGPVPLPSTRSRGWRDAFVSVLEASGLAGRGGAGFPAAIKLAVAHAGGAGGTILVNAMEGEPASDKDKLLLIRSPHLVLDGAQLLAAASAARHVTVCVPEGRHQVAAAVTHALAERAAAGCAPVPEVMVRPPDRFIAGEESALVRWVESGDSLPSFRPDKGTALRIGRREGGGSRPPAQDLGIAIAQIQIPPEGAEWLQRRDGDPVLHCDRVRREPQRLLRCLHDLHAQRE